MADESGPSLEGNEAAVGRHNRRRKSYRDAYVRLPRDVQESADQKFEFFLADPLHKSLRLHRLKDTGKGSHIPGSYSVSVEKRYRALFFVDGDTNVWYWIGSHADYDTLTGG